MPRIAYIPEDASEPKELVDAIRARRGGRLYNLDRMLLHSPPFAKGWNLFMREVRGALSLPAKLRELAICAVAAINGAHYEFHHHAPLLLAAGGSQEQVGALAAFAESGEPGAQFDKAERAVLRLTFEMTRDVQVSDATFRAAQAVLQNEQQVMELVGVVASYNMVSRVLVALGVEPE